MGALSTALDRYFLITQRGSTIEKELRAGLSTFLTVAYILAVNPHILSAAGLPIQEVTTSTALSSAISTLICGLVANLPFAVTPGMGLNAYLAFNQVVGLGMELPVALACCLAASALVALLALVHALTLILSLVPNAIKLATVLGMGLLLSLIGMQSAGVVVGDPHTMVGLGDLLTLRSCLAAGGLALIATLHQRNVKGAFLVGITAAALAFWAITDEWPAQVVALPRMRVWAMDFAPILQLQPQALSAIVAYSLVMIFDIGGAMYGLANLGGLVTADGSVPGAMSTYLSACIGTAVGALTGTSPLIIAAESAVGIKEGGRTGLTACVVALLFGASLLLVPLMQALPEVATAPVLVLVGAMMMSEAGQVDWTRMTVALPAFLTMVVQPFTFSIANGIYAGLAFSFVLHIATGEIVGHVRELLWPGQESSAALDHEFKHSADVEPGALQEPLLRPHPPPHHPHPRDGPSPAHPYQPCPSNGHGNHGLHGPLNSRSPFASSASEPCSPSPDGYLLGRGSRGIAISGGPLGLSRQGSRDQAAGSMGRVGFWLHQDGVTGSHLSHCMHCGARLPGALLHHGHSDLASAEPATPASPPQLHEDILLDDEHS